MGKTNDFRCIDLKKFMKDLVVDVFYVSWREGFFLLFYRETHDISRGQDVTPTFVKTVNLNIRSV